VTKSIEYTFAKFAEAPGSAIDNPRIQTSCSLEDFVAMTIYKINRFNRDTKAFGSVGNAAAPSSQHVPRMIWVKSYIAHHSETHWDTMVCKREY